MFTKVQRGWCKVCCICFDNVYKFGVKYTVLPSWNRIQTDGFDRLLQTSLNCVVLQLHIKRNPSAHSCLTCGIWQTPYENKLDLVTAAHLPWYFTLTGKYCFTRELSIIFDYLLEYLFKILKSLNEYFLSACLHSKFWKVFLCSC